MNAVAARKAEGSGDNADLSSVDFSDFDFIKAVKIFNPGEISKYPYEV